MSGFGDLLTGLVRGMTAQGGDNASPLSAALGQLLNNSNVGGLGGLLSQLRSGGLESQVASWLGNGKNMAVSPDQLRDALSNEHVRELAQQSGLSMDDLLATLSKSLPGVVDHLSPRGRLQESDQGESDQDEPDQPEPDQNESDQPPVAENDDDRDEPSSRGGSLAEQAGLKDIK